MRKIDQCVENSSQGFIQCKRFTDMTSKQRAEILQQYSACARCTSWGHTKDDCKMPVIDCKELINGARCHRDHSHLVCNSGSALLHNLW